MTQTDERRAQGARRVPYETLVEVCSNDPGIPAFEAESVDLSGRGMHVRTAYLPELGAPLVCRLEDQGREILVEGVVAWRNERARGGDFGLKFTALDSGSVEALKALCRAEDDAPRAEPAPAGEGTPNQAGSRVRLHIDGLGSPMKARVREARQSELSVGSNLEFLRVGKRLEIEDLEARGRRIARIDSVTVSIDPQTQVPQLVVGLKYDGEDGDSTPEPSVIGAEAAAPPLPVLAGSSQFAETQPQATATEEADDEGEPAMRGRLSELATSTGQSVARLSAVAAQGVGKVIQDASAKVREYQSRRKTGAVRRTAPAPSTTAEPRKLRPQNGQVAEAVAARIPSKLRSKKVALGAGAAALAVTIAVFATRTSSPPPGAEVKPAQESAVVAAGDVKHVDAEGNPVPSAPPAMPAARKQPMTADVPLFGPTPMATTEPAPLGAPAEELEAAGLAPRGAAARPAVADESWSEDEEDSPRGRKSEPRPEDVKPWGHGKVKEPTVFRLRLDAPGGAIQGQSDPTGFTVLIPGRKLLENGSAIQKRDPRIARVKTQSSGAGAEITFRFKDGVPGYRVRLRRDFVEFLVSEADEAKRTGKTATQGKTATAQKSSKTAVTSKSPDRRR